MPGQRGERGMPGLPGPAVSNCVSQCLPDILFILFAERIGLFA